MNGERNAFFEIRISDDRFLVAKCQLAVVRHVHHEVADASARERTLPNVGAKIVIDLFALHAKNDFGLDAELLRDRASDIDVDATRVTVLLV